MTTDRIIFHRDHTVTYWSVYCQIWTRGEVPDRELATWSDDKKRQRAIKARQILQAEEDNR